MKDLIISKLKEIYDPELPVDIYSLGLIYQINLQEKGNVHILMTLTTPSCPAADDILSEVKRKVEEIPAVQHVAVEITFRPPYTIARMSEEARLSLGIVGPPPPSS